MGEPGQCLESDQAYLQQISKKLNTKVLHQVLSEYAGTDKVTLQGWKAKENNSVKGESYLSDIYRFNIYGTIDSNGQALDVAIIAKGLPKNVARSKTLRSPELFVNETRFYTNVWNKLLEFQKTKTTDVFDGIPRCLAAHTDGENDYILMEDASKLGYQKISRQAPLDLSHVKVIMQLFAKYHSTCLAFKDQQPEEYQKVASNIKESYYSESLRWWYKNFLKMMLNVWLDALEKEVPGSIYYNKFKQLADGDYYSWMCKLLTDKSKYAVICEGDAWQSNVLLTYTDNVPDKSLFIDFQLARNASLATDIVFFLFGCLEPDFRQTHWDDILNEYHTAFVKHLANLGSDPGIFTRADLDNELKEYGGWGIGSLECLPLNLIEDDEVSDLDKIEGTEAVDIASIWVVKPFKQQEKRMKLVKTIVELVERGFI